MSSKSKKSGKKGTQYYESKSQTSKNLFHKPQAYGELINIEMTRPMLAVSAISIAVQICLTAFCIWAFMKGESIAALEEGGFSGSYIYLIFPVFCWLFTLILRFLCSSVPTDMWRLPKKVKKGMVICGGKPLKLLSLLAELVTAVFFLFLSAILYIGRTPSMVPIILWIAALAASIYFPCRKASQAAKEADKQAAIAKAEKEKEKAARAAAQKKKKKR